jgi:regulatory protein
LPRLTGLAPDPRRPGNRLVQVDRGRFASLPEEGVVGLPLEIGAELPPAVFARLRELADVEAAVRAAVRALARRAHARLDLRRRLTQRQHPPAAVDEALERLAAQGLVDDTAFARHFALVRTRRGRGPARVVTDLVSHGVDRRVAEEAMRLALAEEALDPADAARAVAERRAKQLQGLPGPIKKRRLLAFLKRRGFEEQDVKKLVEQVWKA